MCVRARACVCMRARVRACACMWRRQTMLPLTVCSWACVFHRHSWHMIKSHHWRNCRLRDTDLLFPCLPTLWLRTKAPLPDPTDAALLARCQFRLGKLLTKMLHRDERLFVFLIVNNDGRRIRQHCCIVNLLVEFAVSPSDEGDPLAASLRHVDGR